MEFKQGYKKWKEHTTTSPSKRHLGHYHALLSPDGEAKEIIFSEDMWRIHNDITNIALLNKTPLTRWLLSIVILLPKDKGKPKIYRLRIINTYEHDYNLILKLFWPKKGMYQAEKRQWLGDNQTGRRKEMSSTETAVIDELIKEYHRITREALCTHQDDAM